MHMRSSLDVLNVVSVKYGPPCSNATIGIAKPRTRAGLMFKMLVVVMSKTVERC